MPGPYTLAPAATAASTASVTAARGAANTTITAAPASLQRLDGFLRSFDLLALHLEELVVFLDGVFVAGLLISLQLILKASKLGLLALEFLACVLELWIRRGSRLAIRLGWITASPTLATVTPRALRRSLSHERRGKREDAQTGNDRDSTHGEPSLGARWHWSFY